MRKLKKITTGLGTSALCLLAGCFGPSQPAYPATPPPGTGYVEPAKPKSQDTATMTDQTGTGNPLVAPAPTPPLTIPANAQLVSFGDFPPPEFIAPTSNGTLYVKDTTLNKVVAATAVVGDSSGKKMNIIDTGNLLQTMNKNDSFQIYFVPGR